MTPRLKAAMKDRFEAYRFASYDGKPTPWIFHHTRTLRNAVAGERVRSFRDRFNGAVKRAKLPTDLVQHDLRHRRAMSWLQEGKPMHLVQKALGHSTIQVTERYSHLVAEDLRALVDGPSADVRSA